MSNIIDYSNYILLDRLEKGINDIRKSLTEIKESQQRLEDHNSFIVNLYFAVKDPIARIYNRVSRMFFLDDDNNVSRSLDEQKLKLKSY